MSPEAAPAARRTLIRDAHEGHRVEIVGRVASQPGEELPALITRRPCVYCAAQLQEHRGEDEWITIAHQIDCLETFQIEDSTGAALVDLNFNLDNDFHNWLHKNVPWEYETEVKHIKRNAASFELGRDDQVRTGLLSRDDPAHLAFLHSLGISNRRMTSWSFRFVEVILAAGDPVAVIGQCSWRAGQLRFAPTAPYRGRDFYLVLRSPPGEKLQIVDRVAEAHDP